MGLVLGLLGAAWLAGPAGGLNPSTLCQSLPLNTILGDVTFGVGPGFHGEAFVVVNAPTGLGIWQVPAGCGTPFKVPVGGLPKAAWGIAYDPGCVRLYLGAGASLNTLTDIVFVQLAPGTGPCAAPVNQSTVFQAGTGAIYRSLSMAWQSTTPVLYAADWCNGDVDKVVVPPAPFLAVPGAVHLPGAWGVANPLNNSALLVLTSNEQVPAGCPGGNGFRTVMASNSAFASTGSVDCDPSGLVDCEVVTDLAHGMGQYPKGIAANVECAFYVAGGYIEMARWQFPNPDISTFHSVVIRPQGVAMSPDGHLYSTTDGPSQLWVTVAPDPFAPPLCPV